MAWYEEFSSSEQEEYVLGVIKKQAGVSEDKAKEIRAKLSSEQFTVLHNSGRIGKPAICREIIAQVAS